MILDYICMIIDYIYIYMIYGLLLNIMNIYIYIYVCLKPLVSGLAISKPECVLAMFQPLAINFTGFQHAGIQTHPHHR